MYFIKSADRGRAGARKPSLHHDCEGQDLGHQGCVHSKCIHACGGLSCLLSLFVYGFCGCIRDGFSRHPRTHSLLVLMFSVSLHVENWSFFIVFFHRMPLYLECLPFKMR